MLTDPETLENIIAATPGLDRDPVAICRYSMFNEKGKSIGSFPTNCKSNILFLTVYDCKKYWQCSLQAVLLHQSHMFSPLTPFSWCTCTNMAQLPQYWRKFHGVEGGATDAGRPNGSHFLGPRPPLSKTCNEQCTCMRNIASLYRYIFTF